MSSPPQPITTAAPVSTVTVPRPEDRPATSAAEENSSSRSSDHDIERQSTEKDTPWEKDPENAYNWLAWRKAHLITMISTTAFTASAATSIISPAQHALMKEFHVSRVVALLPLSLYVFALGFGPVIGGPLSESLGRLPVYRLTVLCGALFTLGASLTHNFGALCFLRFAAGFCWGPALAIGSGSVAETFGPKTRGRAMATYILMPFLGPGLGPVMGAFATSRQGWRWTQYIILFFAVAALALVLTGKETYPSRVKRRLMKKRGHELPSRPPVLARIKTFANVGFIRPVHMLFGEPLVALICLYIAVNFGVLFSFFAVVPFTFMGVYGFSLEQSGLVFLAVAIGCALGLLTCITCDAKLYRPQLAKYPQGKVLPEHRLYSAMIGSFGAPLGLFWYAWTAKASISWASLAVAIVPFAWGILCLFVSFSQYNADTYKGTVVARAASANSLAKYAFAGAFPLFIIHMYEDIGIDWGVSVFAFVTVALLPIPWAFYRYGHALRARSKYETNEF